MGCFYFDIGPISTMMIQPRQHPPEFNINTTSIFVLPITGSFGIKHIKKDPQRDSVMQCLCFEEVKGSRNAHRRLKNKAPLYFLTSSNKQKMQTPNMQWSLHTPDIETPRIKNRNEYIKGGVSRPAPGNLILLTRRQDLTNSYRKEAVEPAVGERWEVLENECPWGNLRVYLVGALYQGHRCSPNNCFQAVQPPNHVGRQESRSFAHGH